MCPEWTNARWLIRPRRGCRYVGQANPPVTGLFSRGGPPASRADLESFLKKTGAQLWIEHDILANAKLKKAPAFYE